jgi:hypothetical protein
VAECQHANEKASSGYFAILNWIFGDANVLLKYFAGLWFPDGIVGRAFGRLRTCI